MKLTARQQAALDRLLAIDDSNEVFWDEDTVTPDFAKGILSAASDAAPEDVARKFLADNRDLMGFADDFDERLEVSHTESHAAGSNHVFFQQHVAGVAVFEGSVQVHIDQRGRVIAYKDHRISRSGGSTEPGVAADKALAAAREHWPHGAPKNDKPKLCWFRDRDGKTKLAWEVALYDEETLHHSRYFVDAKSGTMLFKFTEVCEAIRTHDANNDRFLPGAKVLEDDQGTTNDAVARAAHEHAKIVHDYFQEKFGRDSYDGQGAPIVSTVHFKRNYNNAFWTSRFRQMVYGDGDGVRFGPLAQALDVVGHELTHAVSSMTARFIYAEQSGALDESFADVFGLFVTNDDEIVDWEVGEGVYTPFRSGDALRDVSRPTRFGQPDHMDDFESLEPGELPDPEKNDNGFVHGNSGIPNKAAFLAIAGGTHHGIEVQGIGRDKAEQVYYLAMTKYLSSATPSRWTFKQARYALLNATRQLFGDSGPEYATFKNAWAAVGVGDRAAPPGSASHEARPVLAIPDAAPAGVRSEITVGDGGQIKDVSVAVKITHTYIGDLRVTLEPPDGDPVVLHNRTGRSTRDINRTFDRSTTPELASLAGRESAGEWRLWVSDHARVDEGTLQRWTLNLQTEKAAPTVEERSFETPTVIPDADSAGIRSELVFQHAGLITNLEVELDVSHTWIGDLRIVLVSPTGKEAVLHDRGGSSRHDIKKTYKLGVDPALYDLFASQAKGTWQLRLSDHARRDEGTLNRWHMKVVTE